MPESLHRKRETIAQLRALADELEADLPPGGDGNGDDEVARARTARERARRLGIHVIQGGAVGAVAAAIGHWARDNSAAAAIALAAGTAAGSLVLAPAVAPHVPGLPVIGAEDGPAPAVTRTIAAPPAPTETVTVSPSTSPTQSPPASPSPTGTPTPEPTPTAPATEDPEPRAGAGDGGAGGGGDEPAAEPTGNGPPPAAEPRDPGQDPPAVTEPETGDEPEAETQSVPCVVGVALPPLLGVCVLGGEVGA